MEVENNGENLDFNNSFVDEWTDTDTITRKKNTECL